MRIYSMTATFGKLENEKLQLQPGLNILSRPNEWGKSTWCAFLIAMLYGVETRVKSTKTLLADKERYAPWSGSPMSGRIELQWQGRNITIERSSKGRVPMGVFRAYETDSGLDVPELTSENCGILLLGVERSVFERSGFIRLADMPVTQNEALRRKLNTLVTTGDESGEAEALAARLRDLQNSCQSNRVRGRIPETSRELEALQATLGQMDAHRQGILRCDGQLEELQKEIEQLENHRQGLLFAASRESAARLAEAEDAANALDARLFQAEEKCMHFPPREQVTQRRQALEALQGQWQEHHAQAGQLPLPPVQPAAPAVFVGMSAAEAAEKADRDASEYRQLAAARHNGKKWLLWAGIALAVAAGLCLLWQPWAAVAGAIAAAAAGVGYGVTARAAATLRARDRERRDTLEKLYGCSDPDLWLDQARQMQVREEEYQAALDRYTAGRQALEQQRQALESQTALLCPDSTLEKELQWQQHMEQCLEQAAALRRDAIQARQQADILRQLHKPALPPMAPDSLTLSRQETEQALERAKQQQLTLQQRRSSHQGALEALGDQTALEEKQRSLRQRLEKLELTNRALILAQEKLAQATAELQRRFAPRISQEAQRLFSTLTGGRYDRLTLSDDLSLHASTTEETGLHSILWRSQGTADQLYLCLRLAVANALAPEAPLVLDDALAHFDDVRAAAAVELLRQMAQDRQILLFTCHSREGAQ